MPAVALTAYGRSEDRARALSAGFQVHVAQADRARVTWSAVVASLTAQSGGVAH